MSRTLIAIALFCIAIIGLPASSAEQSSRSISIVVMDPLAAPLSCPCVEGYAQRKYEVLAEYLEQRLGRKIQLSYGESLPVVQKKLKRPADIVIGKQSVVLADAAKVPLKLKATYRLTDQQGSTEQHGMIVVNRQDPALAVSDLKDYTIFFGPGDAEEKHSAAVRLLADAGIHIAKEKRKISQACSDGACEVIDLGPESKTAAVISSYAQPLLEGCGTIKKGDLRVVAKTDPVPFITLFVADSLDRSELAELNAALESVALQPTVLEALESLVGFMPVEESVTIAKKN